jgi:hypothetical protein
MEFQAKDQHTGQVRVYILPDDVGRGKVDRQQAAARRAMQSLLYHLDISQAAWNGQWSEYTQVKHVDLSLDEVEEDQASLFYVFNTLPSPKPNPDVVDDLYARDAMYNILDSGVNGLTTRLHPYQRRTAAMMLQREIQPSQILDPRLRPIIDQHGQTWYCDLDSSTCFREPRKYEAPRGGICAETMGLGKTLICLALILATKEISAKIPIEYSCGTVPIRKSTGSLMAMAASTIGRTGTPWKSHFAEETARGDDYEKCLEAIKDNPGHYFLPVPVPRRESRHPIIVPPRKVWLTTATVVVVPSNLVRQWELEIKKHTINLKVLVVRESRAKQSLPSAKEMAEYDIILFSKGRFDQEAADGSDSQGRRKSSSASFCRCPYIDNTRLRDCTCFKEEDAYRSPLKDLHIKRLITDEGHTFGNASKSAKTEGVAVVDFLQLSARWIVSGTPTQGLYGAGVSRSSSEESSGTDTPIPESPFNKLSSALPDQNVSSVASKAHKLAFDKQERTDLEKLGNIATLYLKARPWANTFLEGDVAEWSKHVMQPRHGPKCTGNMDCLRSTLEGMIIRHRPEDVEKDVTLPPLYETPIYLDGSIQDKMSLNMFSMMIVSNAVTSERKDADYLFHPRQRTALNLLVSNLRQASFHWSGFTMLDIRSTIDVAKNFLEKGEVSVNADDEILLRQAIHYGEVVLRNHIKIATSQYHEMPMYIENEFPDDVRAAWAIDKLSTNPTLMGVTMVLALQKYVASMLPNPEGGLVEAGKHILATANLAANPSTSSRPLKKSGRNSRPGRKVDQLAPTLAGGKAISSGSSSSPKKRALGPSIVSTLKSFSSSRATKIKETESSPSLEQEVRGPNGTPQKITSKHKSILKRPEKVNLAGTVDPASPLAPTSILSTSSAKLSYLMDRIIIHHASEKILVFYEADNVAYYIAQALECLNIKHLIYAKTLKPTQKAQYVVAFNQSETIRVLLMDISQAAFGLDISSASRVFFVNPVFSPQIEAQAVKRAHRIGQTKPVYVETLILKGSIEEVILDRRKDITNEEHNKCKSILDDQKMYEWIRNVRFIPVQDEGVPGPEQMAKLETPQIVFSRGLGANIPISDAEILALNTSPNSKGKGKARVDFDVASNGDATAAVGSRNVMLTHLSKSEDSILQRDIYTSNTTRHIHSPQKGVSFPSNGADEDDDGIEYERRPRPARSNKPKNLELEVEGMSGLSKPRRKAVAFQLPPQDVPDSSDEGGDEDDDAETSLSFYPPYPSMTTSNSLATAGFSLEAGSRVFSSAAPASLNERRIGISIWNPGPEERQKTDDHELDGLDDIERFELATSQPQSKEAPTQDGQIEEDDDETDYIAPRGPDRGNRVSGYKEKT